MVIDGTLDERRRFVATQFDEGDRLRIPSRFAEQAGLTGNESISCWLLVVTPGRYRLLADTVESAREDLSRILEQQKAVATQGGGLDITRNNERAAIQARLIPTLLSPKGPGWRIVIPKEASLLVPSIEEHSFVFLLLVAGYLEFWFPQTLGRALSTPVSDLI